MFRKLQWSGRQRRKEFLEESLDKPITNLGDLTSIDIQNAIISFNFHDKSATLYINEIAKWKKISRKTLLLLLYSCLKNVGED